MLIPRRGRRSSTVPARVYAGRGNYDKALECFMKAIHVLHMMPDSNFGGSSERGTPCATIPFFTAVPSRLPQL